MKLFTQEIESFILSNYIGLSTPDLTKLINERFGTQYLNTQVGSYKSRHKLRSGVCAQFKKGHIPKNKGTNYCAKGCEKTQFKKGHRPTNTATVGTKSITKDGYIRIKIAEPNKWKFLHILTWEKAYGKIQNGEMILH